MKKAKLELSEFLLLCRQEGYFDLSDIQTAVFEYNGKLSILPVSSSRPLTPEDMSLDTKPSHILREVILDGRIIGDNLKRRGLDEIWLERQLTEKGYKSAKEILLTLCADDDTLSIYPIEN